MTIYFREHRKTFAESLLTRKEFKGLASLLTYLGTMGKVENLVFEYQGENEEINCSVDIIYDSGPYEKMSYKDFPYVRLGYIDYPLIPIEFEECDACSGQGFLRTSENTHVCKICRGSGNKTHGRKI